MNETKVSCKEVMSHICENLGEDLDSPKCNEIKLHLDNCDNCQNYFQNVASTISFYKKYDVKLTNDAHDRLIDFLGLADED